MFTLCLGFHGFELFSIPIGSLEAVLVISHPTISQNVEVLSKKITSLSSREQIVLIGSSVNTVCVYVCVCVCYKWGLPNPDAMHEWCMKHEILRSNLYVDYSFNPTVSVVTKLLWALSRIPSTSCIVNIASEGCGFLELTSWRLVIIRNISVGLK